MALRRREDDWAVHIFHEHSNEADAWARKELEAQRKIGKMMWTLRGLM